MVGTLDRAIGNDEIADAGVHECCGDAFAHLAGADDENATAGQRAESIRSHLDGSMTDRRRASPDGCLGARPLAGFDRVPEQQVECCLGSAFGLRQLPSGAHLAEYLALAEHCRIESRRDLEQVSDGSVVVLAVEVGVQFVGVEPAEIAEEVADVGVRVVEAFSDDVDLGAVARAQHDRFANALASNQTGDRLALFVGSNAQTLEERQCASAMVDTDHHDRHGRRLRARRSSGADRVDGAAGTTLLVIAEDL